MTTRDPFERPSSQPDAWQPDASANDHSTGYAPPGSTVAPPPAPRQSAPAQTAPGFSGGAPPAPPAPYGYAAQPPATHQPAPTSTDGMSIAALVTGILGLGVVAVALGAVGLRRTAGGQRKGTAMAWAGVILGVLGTIVWTAVITWGIAATSAVFESEEFQSGVDSAFDSDATYGDDAALDELWDQCEAGDMAACDELYYASAVGSEYEDFGYSCGERGRSLIQLSCADGSGE